MSWRQVPSQARSVRNPKSVTLAVVLQPAPGRDDLPDRRLRRAVDLLREQGDAGLVQTPVLGQDEPAPGRWRRRSSS